MGRDEFVTEFLERGLHGFYLAVLREGEVEAGDPIVELRRDPRRFGVTEVARLLVNRDDADGLQSAAELDVLPESWRNYFRKRLSHLERTPWARQSPLAAPGSRPTARGRRGACRRRTGSPSDSCGPIDR